MIDNQIENVISFWTQVKSMFSEWIQHGGYIVSSYFYIKMCIMNKFAFISSLSDIFISYVKEIY